MAILLYFAMVREDAREVEYAFGHNRAELDRRLVVDKGSAQGEPRDGQRDPAFARVYGKIVRRHRAEGRWPAHGVYAA